MLNIDSYAPQQNFVEQEQEQKQNIFPSLNHSTIPLLTPPTLRSIIEQEECVLLYGAKGSGKTTVLKHFAKIRLEREHQLIRIDPHTVPEKWPIDVHGQGRDYSHIFSVIFSLEEMVTSRYKELAEGRVKEGRHPYLTVIIDEYRSIISEAKQQKIEISKIITMLLTEARKINIWLVVATHSKNVKTLGFDGEGALREGFVMISLERMSNGERTAKASWNGGEEKPIKLLGPIN